MKKIGFYGNCQTIILSNLIQELDYIKKNFCVIKLKQVQLVRKKDIEALISSIQKLDILIYQKVKGDNKKSTDFLLKYTKSSCQKICIPSCYFEGYNPELTKIKVNGYPISNPLTGQLHDIFVLANYLKNENTKYVEEENDLFYNKNIYNKSFLDTFFDWTIKQLKYREVEGKVHISISEYIVNNYKNQRLFVDTNHPRIPIYIHILDEIFKLLQINIDISQEFTFKDLNSIEHGHGHQYCIYPSISKSLNFHFKQNLNYQFNGTIFDRKKFTSTMISSYKEMNHELLLKSLESNSRYILFKEYFNSSLSEKESTYFSFSNSFSKKLCTHKDFFSSNIENIEKIALKYIAENNIMAAQEYYRYLIAFDSENPYHYVRLARLFKKKNMVYEAIAYYKQAISVRKKLPFNIYKELIDLLSRKSNNVNIKDAISICQQACENQSNLKLGFYLKFANLLLKDGQTDLAIHYCKIGLESNPNSFNLYLSMGNAFVKQNKLNKAINCFKKVIELKPDCHHVYKRLGDVLKNNSELDLAVGYYKKALIIKPEAAYIYRSLGDTLAKKGQQSEAQFCYQQANAQ